jgi:hypothetical protein
MATITAAAGGGNWNVGSTWVGGVVPLTTDDVVLNATSGQVTITATAQCVDINFTGYTNTITFNANLTITGNLTRIASVFSYAGTGGIIIAGTTTQIITTTSVAWTIPVTFGGASPSISINGAFNITAPLTLSSTTSPVISRANVFDLTENVNASGNITISGNGTYTGSANIVVSGSNNQTLTASGNHQIRNNLTIDKTGGVLTLSGTLNYNTGTLTYVASGGTINATAMGLVIRTNTTLNTGAISWGSFTVSYTQVLSPLTVTITLNSDLNVSGALTLIANANPPTLTFTGTGNINATGDINITQSYFGGGIGYTVNFVNTVSALNLITSGANTLQTITLNGGTLNLSGGITLGNTFAGIVGTTNINLVGTGNINCGSGASAMSIRNNLTINTSGTITLVNNLNYSSSTFKYISGTLNFSSFSLVVSGTTTLDTSGVVLSSVIFSNSTTTLLSNLNVSNMTTQGTSASFAGAFTINVVSNLAINATTSGASTPIVINGTGNQTWTATAYLSNNLTINKASGTLTLGIDVYYRTGTLTFVASGGTVNTTTNNSRLNSNASTTFVTDGIVWNNATFSGNTPTFTLTNNFTLSGTLTLSGQVGTNTTINNGDINLGGLLVTTTSSIIGSSIINFTGTGTWNHTAAGYILKNININTSGTLTLGANIYYSVNKITYISGTVDSSTNSNTLNILLSNTNTWFSVNLDTAGMSWYNIALTSSGGTARTFTLTSDLSILNTFSLTNAGISSTTTYAGNGSINCNILLLQGTNGNSHIHNFNNTNIYTNDLSTEAFTAGTQNTLNNANLYISRNIRIGNSSLLAPIAGTIQIYYVGNGTWTSRTVANQSISASFTINTSGVLTLSGNVYFAGANTFTYRNGKVNTKNSTLNITGNSTFVNCNKINFDNVLITAGNTITMNEFFSGSPILKTKVQSTTTANYTVTFTDNFEKIAKFVTITNCTLSRPQQLLVITDSKKSSTNTRGIRYINNLPNGISKGDPSIQNILTPGQSNNLLIGDPAFVKTI